MTALAPYISSFLREHLPKERRASLHTCEAYAHSFRLLVGFAANRLDVRPCRLEIEQLDVPLILAFLEDIEANRGNSARTRNARLAAINAFFRFLEYRLPACLDQASRIHAIPMKKTDEALVDYLTRNELQALLDAPNARTLLGIRDRAMLHLAFAAGLRVSELVGLRLDQLDQPALSTIHVLGKGRRERVLPLWKETANALKAWLAVGAATKEPALFLNALGRTMTRAGFELHPRQARSGGRPIPAHHRRQASDPTHSSSHLRHAHAPSHAGHPKGLPLAWARQPAKYRDLSQGGPNGEARSARYDLGADVQAGPVSGAGQAAGNAEHRQPLS
jgi:integrase/recombinase XerD